MARLAIADQWRLAMRGLRGRPLRFVLSAIGIAIGVGSMVAVAGITQSSRVELNNQLAQLGTNLLRVYPADDLQGHPTVLPPTAAPMISRIGPVTAASAVGELKNLAVYRSPYVPTGHTSSVAVDAVDVSLLATLRGSVAAGHWFTPANAAFPTVVLGAAAANRLGIHTPGTMVWIHDQWWTVIGVLKQLTLASDLDGAALLPRPAATTYANDDGTDTSVYARADDDEILAVSNVIPATASPQHPDEVGIDRPTDALTAQLAANDTLNRLLIGLAAVGLLVGGVGISNTMIIAVIERRQDIGLRRALGATRGNIATQFLAESALMSACGGLGGVLLGYAVTVFYSSLQHWGISLPLWVGATAVIVTAVIGAVAGLYPAVKASRESPTQALSSA